MFIGILGLALMTFSPCASIALTLEECVELALKNNPDLQKQQMNQQYAHSDLAEKKSQSFGRIDAVASYTHYNLPRTLVPMTPAVILVDPMAVATTEDLFVTGVMYEVALFTGFAQKRTIEIAALQKEMAGAALKLGREQLIYNVKTLYVNILSLQTQEEAQIAYIKALQQLYNDIIHELQLGKRARIDQLKAAADLENARAQKAQISSSLTIVKATLATLMNVDLLADFQNIPIHIEPLETGESGYGEQIRELQRYRLAQLEIEKSEKLIEKSNAALYPQVFFNAFYGQNFGPNDGSNPNKDDWQNKEVWQAGLNLKWNIFDFGERSSNRQKANIAKQQSLQDRLKTELELKRALIEAVTKIDTAIIEYNSAKAELAMTRETENIEQVRFNMGAGDLNDLLQAKARNQLALSRSINTGYSYKNARFYLDY
ncbi:MAG: hypothetical protein DRH32_07915, partial [Deltaproteobacteria bacterium]